MRHPRRIVLAVVALTACASPGASADQPSNGDGFRLVTPDRRFGGLTAGDVMGQGWHRVYAQPKAHNSFRGNSKPCIRLGRDAKALFAIHSTCTVPQGTAVFINGISGACSDVREPILAFGGVNEADQRKCIARPLRRAVESVTLAVDGGEPIDLHKRRYRIFSPQRKVRIPENNIFGVTAQRATYTAAGYEAWLTRLPPGRYPLSIRATFHRGAPHVSTPVINVIRRHRNRDND